MVKGASTPNPSRSLFRFEYADPMLGPFDLQFGEIEPVKPGFHENVHDI